MKVVACILSSSVKVLSTHCLIFAVFSSITGSSLYCFTYSTYSSEVPFKNRRTSSFIAGQMPQSGTQRQGDPHLKDLHQYIPGDRGCESPGSRRVPEKKKQTKENVLSCGERALSSLMSFTGRLVSISVCIEDSSEPYYCKVRSTERER